MSKFYHSAKQQSHKVSVKVVSTDIKQEEFENMLTENKITFAKAERFISKRSGTLLPMCLVELKEAATVEAPIAENLVCQKSGMIFMVEEFRTPPSLHQAMLSLSRFRTFSTKLRKVTCLC